MGTSARDDDEQPCPALCFLHLASPRAGVPGGFGGDASTVSVQCRCTLSGVVALPEDLEKSVEAEVVRNVDHADHLGVAR